MLAFFSNTAARVRRDEKGATAVEYGIMVALIAVVIVVAVSLIGGNLNSAFKEVQCSVGGGKYTAGAKATDTTAEVVGTCAYPA
jgi:pilus assembly protein Flp/PilA